VAAPTIQLADGKKGWAVGRGACRHGGTMIQWVRVARGTLELALHSGVVEAEQLVGIRPEEW
jgi:hypothetical protein